jgi:hypothetical protein
MLLSTIIAAMSGVPAERHWVASALLNVSRQLGGALGLAALTALALLRDGGRGQRVNLVELQAGQGG